MSDSKSPRLCILHTECNTSAGGQALRLLRESQLLAVRGHRLVIACRPDSALSELARQAGLLVQHFPFPARGVFGPGLLFSLVGFMRRLRPQVVNTHSSVDSWAAGLAARLAGVPVVVRTRHIQATVKPSCLNRFLYGRVADRVITTGERIADLLASDLRLPRVHFVSIPTGVDLTRFSGQADRAAVRREWRLTDGQPAIGIVAALRGMKNHPLFLQLAARLRRSRPEARFFIIGEGPRRESLEGLASELGLSEVVTFTGRRADMPEVLAALDVVVLCSARGEGCPQVLSQALAMGRPVVATEVGSVAELVRNEETGLLTPPDDVEALTGAVERLLRAPALAARLARAGQELVRKEFGEARMADAVESLLLALYQNKRAANPPISRSASR